MHLASSLLTLLLVSSGCAQRSNGNNEYAPKVPPLTTPWTDKVGRNPWPEYPRPQLQRSEWKNLNGIWRYESAPSLESVQHPPFGKQLTQEVLVPSCLESGLSGGFLVSYLTQNDRLTLASRDPRREYAVFLVLHLFHGPFVMEKSTDSPQL